MDLGTKIRHRREQLGLSQAELARACGLTQARISEWESGARTQMSLQNLRSLARALGVSADYLIGTWEDDAGTAPPAATPAPPEGSAPGGRRRGRPRKAATS
jgi:transcriptional regulator with XRE-family HTH domain